MARNNNVFDLAKIDSLDGTSSAVGYLARLVYILMADLALSRLSLMRETRPYTGTV